MYIFIGLCRCVLVSPLKKKKIEEKRPCLYVEKKNDSTHRHTTNGCELFVVASYTHCSICHLSFSRCFTENVTRSLSLSSARYEQEQRKKRERNEKSFIHINIHNIIHDVHTINRFLEKCLCLLYWTTPHPISLSLAVWAFFFFFFFVVFFSVCVCLCVCVIPNRSLVYLQTNKKNLFQLILPFFFNSFVSPLHSLHFGVRNDDDEL